MAKGKKCDVYGTLAGRIFLSCPSKRAASNLKNEIESDDEFKDSGWYISQEKSELVIKRSVPGAVTTAKIEEFLEKHRLVKTR